MGSLKRLAERGSKKEGGGKKDEKESTHRYTQEDEKEGGTITAKGGGGSRRFVSVRTERERGKEDKRNTAVEVCLKTRGKGSHQRHVGTRL